MNTPQKLVEGIHNLIPHPIRIMEVCGTHTVSIFRSGIKSLLTDSIRLISGPGCPVCVTSIEDVDKAIVIARKDNVILATFGDMMRVPGSSSSFQEERAKGRDIRIVYSPTDSLKIAEENQDRKVVFFATGFETTSPSVAVLAKEAMKLDNLFIYSVHKIIPPALSALIEDTEVNVDAFIMPGHVSTILGTGPYLFIAQKYKKPCIVTGFEPMDVLEAIYMIVKQMAEKKAEVEIQYKRAVRKEGNPKAVAIMNEVFEPADSNWRGIGVIPNSGLRLRKEYGKIDAESIFEISVTPAPEPKGCSCGEVLRGIKIPPECKLFAKVCTPEHPYGACMVSTEGSCAAYYKYGR
jgi:hydrogenase expression/formation protein HypD